MNLPDTNVWLALALSKHVFHAATSDWLARQSTAGSVLFCRATQQSFLRLLTTEAILRPYDLPPLTNNAAWGIYQAYIADRRIDFAAEPAGAESRWQELATPKQASPKLWMDAYLAAVAIAGGHTLVTTDRAFKQFKGLNVELL